MLYQFTAYISYVLSHYQTSSDSLIRVINNNDYRSVYINTLKKYTKFVDHDDCTLNR